jgi:MFS family permease
MSTTTSTRRPGTARSALQHRHFRVLFIGASLSNVGTWMQNFMLPAYLDVRTGSAAFVGLLVFAQLGPMLFGSVPAGVLADRVNRTHLILAMQASMMTLSLVLAGLAKWHAPIWTIFAIQLAIGISNTVQAPAFNASLPTLVPREDIGGAVSLNSAMINGSRIAGPSLAAFLGWVGLDLWQLFLINAATYSFVMIPLARNHLPLIKGMNTAKGWRALTTGVGLARRRKVLLVLLRSMFIFSIVSLPYIGLFPSVARLNLGLAADSGSYKILYIIWGLGAFLGALSVGTVFSDVSRHLLIRWSFRLFAVFLFLFALTSNFALALPVSFVLGAVYFLLATAMMTELQHNLTDGERASIMPLWFMSFGGSIPIGNLLGGPIMDAVGARWVLAVGALAAALNGAWSDLGRLGPNDFLDGEPASIPETGPSRLH